MRRRPLLRSTPLGVETISIDCWGDRVIPQAGNADALCEANPIERAGGLPRCHQLVTCSRTHGVNSLGRDAECAGDLRRGQVRRMAAKDLAGKPSLNPRFQVAARNDAASGEFRGIRSRGFPISVVRMRRPPAL